MKIFNARNTSLFSVLTAMFVYAAAYEGSLAAENALMDKLRSRDYATLPWVIFTDLQVAGVGIDENAAVERGFDPDVATVALGSVPRAIVGHDTRGFIKLIRDRSTNLILGARVLAPEGGELVMAVALAIRSGITSSELAAHFHPYLTLSEGIKLAALSFQKDINRLSCCAT